MDTIIEHTPTSSILQLALKEKAALPISDASLEKAHAVLSKFGIPEVKNERYKYANISRLMNDGAFTFSQAEIDFSESFLENIVAPTSKNILVTLNGKVIRFELDESFSLTSINDYLSAHPEVTFDENDSMQALALLTATQGFYLHVKSTSAEPLVWYNIISANAPTYNATLNAITTAAGTEAEILEIRIAKNESVFTNQFTQVYTRANANLRISVSDNYLAESGGIFSTVAFQEKESTFSHSILATDGKFVRQNITAEHGGENCHTEMNGFYAASGNRHQDFSTTVKHMLPNCTSDELYKGVAADQSKAIFNGKVYVARDAQKTNAYQSNKNILLSDEALIRSKPELEIYADDVKCSHGSTTGQTDTKSLFYLRSRGIREKEAQKMLMLAFAGDVLERITNEQIRNYLSEIAGDKLQEIL